MTMAAQNEATNLPANSPDFERASVEVLDEDELKLVITRRGDTRE